MNSTTSQIPLEAVERIATELLPTPGTADVTIEVMGEDLGDQVEADRLPWHALVYDVDNDLIELSVGGVDHRVPVVLRHWIRKPTQVWLEQEQGRALSLLIESSDAVRTLVRFYERPALGTGN